MAAVTRYESYLERLPLDAARRLELQQAATADMEEVATDTAMAKLHHLLAGKGETAVDSHPREGGDPCAGRKNLDSRTPGVFPAGRFRGNDEASERSANSWNDHRAVALASVAARLNLVCGTPSERATLAALARHGGRRLAITPPLRRSSMAPSPWPLRFSPLNFWPLSWGRTPCKRSPGDQRPGRLTSSNRGRLRRTMLVVLTVSQTALAAWSMTSVLPYHGTQPLEVAILILFSVLFFWISAGFWTAIMGFFLLLLGRDSYVASSVANDAPIAAAARTAVVMPICNENVARVFAGLRATYESLARHGPLEHFDFFILSDSSDPDLRVAETEAWLRLCREVKGAGRIFYRWRRNRIKRKSGNIGDFCRRWGGNYRYMVVLDADSIMTGECLTRLVRLMEANPTAGIIQTAPRAVGRDTLHARVQQFASRVYGPLFAAGLHFWQLGESHYWGHNAIIRVAPFIRHCALGRLPKRGMRSTTGVEILSHDFVEAALMRRAGWSVWIAHDLPGSYEETPPNLLDELKRDQRWCLGNLINFRLLFAEGLHPAHRVVFATGVMAYFSAPLWFLFLLLSTMLLAVHALIPPQYFVHPYQLFPLWPQWHKEWAVVLAGATATLLFIPKILGALLPLRQGVSDYGGVLRLLISMAGESLYSMLLAPVRMLFHTKFVAGALAGLHSGWKSPSREDAETTWGESLRQHGWHALLGIVWASGVFWLNPSYLWWLLPVTGALAVSIAVSVWSSRVSLGRWLRRARIFLIPEETVPPPEISGVRAYEWATKWATQPDGIRPTHDFVSAVVDPIDNAIACAAGSHMRPPGGVAAQAERRERVRIALTRGPDALKAKEKMDLLDDPQLLAQLHFAVWASNAAHPSWQAAIDNFTPDYRRSRAVVAST
ncbi:MAG TPA: glucans biosynthesis glucosyltransferase MdoH [Rhodocyclaceae bacterium]|nr:glucans biosynthesis glucosyltransferase MdoH [Rhodocyclaceae bacterium]